MIEYIRLWAQIRGDKRAVTAVEYGIMAALIATALITSVGYLTGGISSAFSTGSAGAAYGLGGPSGCPKRLARHRPVRCRARGRLAPGACRGRWPVRGVQVPIRP